MTRIPIDAGGEYALVPEGVHLAVCKWEGLTLQNSVYSKSPDGKVVKQRFVFQIDEKVPGKDRRFAKHVFFTLSMNEKSNLRKFVEGWLGRPISGEAKEFDTSFMLNRSCQLNITHEAGTDGKVRDVVKGVMPLPKGVPNPPFDVEWYVNDDGSKEQDKWVQANADALAWVALAHGTPEPVGEDEGIPF
ncbi:MAG: hypothetical protein NUV51_08255 [Sulfuricaulis sp.]|nr:hypothetical protein [Sulfuricaulis sp.]